MAEEFQAGICSGNWWNSSRSVLSTGLSPCSLAINNDIGCYSPWQTDMADHLKVARSCAEESNLVSDNSFMVFQDVHAPKPCSTTSSGRGSNLNYSNLQMMGYGLSPSSTSSNWNQSLLGGRSPESNIHSMVEENMDTKLEYRRQDIINDTQIQKEDWDMETFSSCANQVSPIDSFKPIAHQEFGLDQQSVSTVTSGTPSIAAQDSTTSGFSLASTNSYGSYIQSLFDADPQPQPSLFHNQSSNYSSTATYSTKDSSANWSKFSSFLKPSAPKQQNGGSVFANNTLFWNASAAALNDIRSNIFNSPQSPYVLPNEDKPNRPTSITKSKTEEVRQDSTESVLKKNTTCEPAIKRPRIETPSPLPTFKVRKEKLGDRITCLQQLVSPFGKTDTASVLHEAIEYIKFLHAQVNNLSAPYMKSGIPSQHPQGTDTFKETDDSKDLRSRGLCLVPISSTYAVANETTADFWTPSFGSTFR